MRDNIQELLKPRVKCIADFWDNPFKVGEVIQFTQETEYHDFITGELQGKDWLTDFLPDDKTVTRYMYWMRKFIPYPHLFRRLEWWEERSPEDMPGYLKHQSGYVEKVSRYDFSDDAIYLSIKGGEARLSFKYLVSRTIPATSTDYLNQTNQP